MAQCKQAMDGKKCNVPAEEGTDCCILHQVTPKDVEKFKQALYKQLDEDGSEDERNPRFSFSGYCFPVGIINGPASLRNKTQWVMLPVEMGEVQFNGARIEGNASFSGAKIEGNASFCGTKIEGAAVFDEARINGSTWFRGCEAGDLYLGVGAPRIRGWGQNRCGLTLKDAWTAPSFWIFAQRTFSKNGRREKADAAFYFARLWRWRDLRKTKPPAGSSKLGLRIVLLRALYWVLWAMDCVFLRWTTAYGASLVRLIATWFIVIGSFGAAFSMAPSLMGRENVVIGSLRRWIEGLHFSVTTFTTLGLGNFAPVRSWGLVLTSVEAVLGGFLIALAVLVIGRKFMRQL